MALGEIVVSGRRGSTQDGHPSPTMQVDPDQTFALVVGAEAVQSVALGVPVDGGVDSVVLRVSTSGDAWIKIGADPTAEEGEDGNLFLPSNSYEYIRITPGHKLSVIQDTNGTAGVMSVTVMV